MSFEVNLLVQRPIDKWSWNQSLSHRSHPSVGNNQFFVNLPQCNMNSKVLTVKSQTETHFRKNKHIMQPVLNPKNRLRSETHWQLFFYLDFRPYLFKATGPNCFIVSCKIFLSSNIIAKSISWSTKRPQKQSKQRWSSHSRLMTLLHCGHHRIYI